MNPYCPNNACRHGGPKGPTKVIGHGWFPVRHGRRRRYRCLGCGGTFSRRIDTAYYRFRCSRRTFDRVANMAVEGCGGPPNLCACRFSRSVLNRLCLLYRFRAEESSAYLAGCKSPSGKGQLPTRIESWAQGGAERRL